MNSALEFWLYAQKVESANDKKGPLEIPIYNTINNIIYFSKEQSCETTTISQELWIISYDFV